jgi:BREX system ATP-binding protein BrxC/D
VTANGRQRALLALEQLAEYGVPPAGSARLIDVGTDRYLEFFRSEILEDFVSRGAGSVRFYEGPYGSGKTHLLEVLTEEALDAGFAVARIDLSTASGLADWHMLTERILSDLEVRLPAGSARSLPRILELLSYNGDHPSNRLRERPLPHSGFARAMDLALRGDASPLGLDLIEQFLTGNRVSVRDLHAAGVRGVKHPLSSRNAEYVLRTVLGGLRLAGLRGTLLAFDEAEKSFTRNSGRVRAGANLLRRFVDAAAAGGLWSCVAIFAVLPGFVEAAARVYPALGQRVLPVVEDGLAVWRSPFIRVSDVAESGDPDVFLAGLVGRIVALVSEIGGDLEDLQERLAVVGHEVLQRNAGSGVRRDLCKALCGIAARHLESS